MNVLRFVIMLTVILTWLTIVSLYAYDAQDRINRLENTRITVSEGRTVLICKNVAAKLYYCQAVVREVKS